LVGVVHVGGDLPAAHVDRLETGLHLLNRLGPRDRAEGRDMSVAVESIPESRRPPPGQAVFDLYRASQAIDVFRAIGPFDAMPALKALPLLLQAAGE
jgi:hypothetical protein